MLLIDLADKTLTIEEQELLSYPFVSGVILFSRNFYDKAQLQDLIQEIRCKVKKPLLITVDQEGGRVQRFREGFTTLPAMQAFQVLNQPQLAKEAGWVMAAEMFAMDIDLSFAPVLDLGHQSQAIGDRAFGQRIEEIIPLANGFIDGMHEVGMASTGKHFPGHGAVVADSHLETPIDNRSKTVIFQQDLQPFQQLIASGKLDAIMPAHIIYTACDTQPASGSPYWLKQILRQQLGFKGVIFSDDLGMKGAGVLGNYVERSQKALAAGCDLLLLCNNREGVIQVLDRLNYCPTQAQRELPLTLMKKRHLTWNELTASPRWQRSSKQLDALQQQWLAWKAENG